MPAGVVTATGPVLAPAGTEVSISVGETTENVAATPLNVTSVALVKLLPVIVTAVPSGPVAGESDEIAGAVAAGLPPTVKSVVLWAVPLPVVTASLPVVAFVGTDARICVADTTL